MDSKLGNFLFYGYLKKILHPFLPSFAMAPGPFPGSAKLDSQNPAHKIVCSRFKVYAHFLKPMYDFFVDHILHMIELKLGVVSFCVLLMMKNTKKS